MKTETLWKLTAATCLGFGAYCLAAAALIIAFEAVAFFIIFALIFAAFGVFYLAIGISMLRKGKFGHTAFIGVFGVFFWWGPGLPWYCWPMIIMPIAISLMYIAIFFHSNLAREE